MQWVNKSHFHIYLKCIITITLQSCDLVFFLMFNLLFVNFVILLFCKVLPFPNTHCGFHMAPNSLMLPS